MFNFTTYFNSASDPRSELSQKHPSRRQGENKMSNPPLSEDTGGQIVSNIPVPLTVEYAQRSIRMHWIAGTELDTVAGLSNSIHLTFFGLCAGAAIAFAVVLTTGNITDPMTHAGYVSALITSGVLAFYFGIRGVRDYRLAKRKLKEIKNGK